MAQKQITVSTSLVAVQAGDNTLSVGIAPVIGTSPFFNVYDANQNLLAAVNPNGTYVWSAASSFFIPGQTVGYVALASGSNVFFVTDLNVLPRAVAITGPAQNVSAATGAITVKSGAAFITYGAAGGVYTLALPIPFLDDNKQVEIISTTAQAHTVTTPASGYNGSLHVATFTATAGSSLTLRAFGGSWYVPNTTGITLT